MKRTRNETTADRRVVALAFVAMTTVATPAFAQDAAIYSGMDRHHPVWAKSGMVAAQDAIAAEVGLEMLRKGGNAVDAGVAVALTMAVTLPRAGNLGGGGFMMIHDAESGETSAIDYREMAPASATRDMYLDAEGNADSELSRYHGKAIGVPGTVAGMEMALERYGTMSLADVLEPAIRLAEEGFPISTDLSDTLKEGQERLRKSDASAAIFFRPDGTPFERGDTLVQKDLAGTLRRIAERGADGFYKGETAEKFAAAVQAKGGGMTVEDLAGYEAVMREPVTGTYRGYEIVSMPPPSSGGIHIVEILNILEAYPIGFLGHNSAETIHLMAEAMKFAYADRSEYLGDPDFNDVPMRELTSKAYAASLRERISRNVALPSDEILPGDLAPFESDQTTHFSVVDKDGNAVSNTYTLNFSYGSGFTADGTGVLMNNEMDDFSAKPGVANAYGLVGGDANAVEPAKRPLSSMSPTIVTKDGEVYLVTGSPGGSRIITTVLQVVMNVIDHGMNIAEANEATRIHHQWSPDELRVEEGLSIDTLAALEAKGHKPSLQETMGTVMSIMIDRENGLLLGSADPRTTGSAATGY